MSQSVVWAVVPAAGVGSRMKTSIPKQYLPLLTKPVIFHTIQRLSSIAAIQGIWVGISKDDTDWPGIEAQLADLSNYSGSYTGGRERAQTVLNGLNSLANQADPQDWVLVHDAARPCVRQQDVDKLIAEVRQSGGEGGLLALAIADTVKRANDKQQVLETVDRKGLWRAQTPQMFRLGPLKMGLEQALDSGQEITDEASAMEFAGCRPLIVSGHADNIKITVPEDLALAEWYLQQQRDNNACE